MAFSVFVGIDPGISGAIAVITGTKAAVFAMPTKKEKVGGKQRSRVDRAQLAMLWELEVMCYGRQEIFVCLEKLGPIGQMGKPKAKKGKLLPADYFIFPERRETTKVVEVNEDKGQGFAVATTNFQLGRSLGQLEMLLAMSDVEFDEVPWRTWSQAFGIGKKDKKVSLTKARDRFPKVPLPLAGDHGKAEALLLAEFGRMMKGAF